jgi:adenylate cyclase
LSLPDKPSIAVLPFQNMSGDPEQDYFADGIVEEIITGLSRIHWLFVIARNSSFTYKGRAVDVKQVGRELGVRYVVEGSVRKAANRVRITGQLIDASTGAHLWADHFDGSLQDIFDLQDQVTASVVAAITPRLLGAEIERAKRKRTENLDAYDYYLRGMASLYQWTKDANGEALRLFHKAIELDPGFAPPYGLASACYIERKANAWMVDRAREVAEAGQLARRAVELGKEEADTLSVAGFALAYIAHELEAGATYIDRAIMLNLNLAKAWYYSGFVKAFLGEPEVAIERLQRAMRLSPLDPLMPFVQHATGFAHCIAGRYDEASSWANKTIQQMPNRASAIRLLAASSALGGRLEEAQKLMARARQIDPAYRVSDVKAYIPFRRPEDLARYEEGLRKAGLPE